MLLRITPGSTDEIVRKTLEQGQHQAGQRRQLALWLGLARRRCVALTTSMGQIERGANRIYGIQRDRPALHKYGRAVLMALHGRPALAGRLPHHRRRRHGGRGAGADVYDWQDIGLHVWQALRFPVGILLALGAFTLLIERSPRRRQPGWSWIAHRRRASRWCCGSLFTYAALAVRRRHSGSFGSTYGPLTGVMALLLWAYLTSIALFLGIAFCAQLEAVRAGVREPSAGDPEAGRQDHETRVPSPRPHPPPVPPRRTRVDPRRPTPSTTYGRRSAPCEVQVPRKYPLASQVL